MNILGRALLDHFGGSEDEVERDRGVVVVGEWWW
jgi:hypothetical protein